MFTCIHILSYNTSQCLEVCLLISKCLCVICLLSYVHLIFIKRIQFQLRVFNRFLLKFWRSLWGICNTNGSHCYNFWFFTLARFRGLQNKTKMCTDWNNHRYKASSLKLCSHGMCNNQLLLPEAVMWVLKYGTSLMLPLHFQQKFWFMLSHSWVNKC